MKTKLVFALMSFPVLLPLVSFRLPRTKSLFMLSTALRTNQVRASRHNSVDKRFAVRDSENWTCRNDLFPLTGMTNGVPMSSLKLGSYWEWWQLPTWEQVQQDERKAKEAPPSPPPGPYDTLIGFVGLALLFLLAAGILTLCDKLIPSRKAKQQGK